METKKQNKHLKPLYWGLFSVGGTVAAFALAAITFIVCMGIPFGWFGSVDKFYESMHGFCSHWFVFLVLAGLIFTIMWHGTHRLYYVLHDMHIHVDDKVKYGLYFFTIAAFLITLLVGWF